MARIHLLSGNIDEPVFFCQAGEIHEDNIRWKSQMAGNDMVQSIRQQGCQEASILHRCQNQRPIPCNLHIEPFMTLLTD